MKWLSNVRETYGYLSGALTGETESPKTPVVLDGTLVPRPLREALVKACRQEAGGLLIDGLTIVSVRTGDSQMVISGPEVSFGDLGSKDLNLLPLAAAVDGPAAIHQAIFNQSGARAIVQTPGVYAAVLAGSRRMPAGDVLDVPLKIIGHEQTDLSAEPVAFSADGMLVPRIGLIAWGETVAECFRKAKMIETWCHISWVARGLDLVTF